MISKTLAVPSLLAASVAVPYMATNAPTWMQEWNSAAPPAAAAAPSASGVDAAALKKTADLTAAPRGPGSVLYPIQTPLEGAAAYSLADVLRLDVTKEWVYQRWPRKSTALAQLDMYGIRVPLVTGTQLTDLAGSLTYFFGADGRVRQISFRGRTGDTTQLVALATQRFGLQPQPAVAVGEQLYQLRRGDQVMSQLRTRPASVLWASSPHDSFAVELDFQDPATARPLPQHSPPPPAPKAPAAEAGGKPAPPTSDTQPAADSRGKATSGWKALFPRRGASSGQIKNLDYGNLYQ